MSAAEQKIRERNAARRAAPPARVWCVFDSATYRLSVIHADREEAWAEVERSDGLHMEPWSVTRIAAQATPAEGADLTRIPSMLRAAGLTVEPANAAARRLSTPPAPTDGADDVAALLLRVADVIEKATVRELWQDEADAAQLRALAARPHTPPSEALGATSAEDCALIEAVRKRRTVGYMGADWVSVMLADFDAALEGFARLRTELDTLALLSEAGGADA